MEPSFGSGSALLGGTDALKEAMARRGQGVSTMAQAGGSAPTAQGMPQAPQGSAMPQGAPGGLPPMPGNAPPVPGMLNGSPEAELIINALSNRLKSDSKIKEAQAIPPEPKMPQAPQAF